MLLFCLDSNFFKKKKMIRRKSQLEINNELLNQEMKTIFSQVSKNGDEVATEINNNKSTINVNVTDSDFTHVTKQYEDYNHASNNNNMAYNKNYVPMQTFHNESIETDSTTFNSNLLTDIYLTDDLSLLPMIDDKAILSTLKAKFENRKYFVGFFFLLLYINNFIRVCLYNLCLELYWRTFSFNQSERKFTNLQ